MIKSPKVSIVTPMYNSSAYIMDAYRSLAQQTCSNWEWLVADDCSTDASREIVSQICRTDARVSLFTLPANSGAAVARNRSLQQARGEFVAFLDSDDLWLEDKLKLQTEFMGNTKNFSFTPYYLASSNGEHTGVVMDSRGPIAVNYEDMLRKRATLGCSTVMLRRAAYPDLLMPLLRTGQDYALWLRLLKSGDLAYKLNTPLSVYRKSRGSLSANKVRKALRQWDTYRSIEGLSVSKSANVFCHYAFRAIFRR